MCAECDHQNCSSWVVVIVREFFVFSEQNPSCFIFFVVLDVLFCVPHFSPPPLQCNIETIPSHFILKNFLKSITFFPSPPSSYTTNRKLPRKTFTFFPPFFTLKKNVYKG